MIKDYIMGVARGNVIPVGSDPLLQSFLDDIEISSFSDWESFFIDKQGKLLERRKIQDICSVLYDVVTDGKRLLKLFRLETGLFVSELSEIFENREILSKYADNAVRICEKTEGDFILSIQYGQYILLCMTCVRQLFFFALCGIEQESNQFYYDLMVDLAKLIKRLCGQEFNINPYILLNREWYDWENCSNGMCYVVYLTDCLSFQKEYGAGSVTLGSRDSVFRCFIRDVISSRNTYLADASFGFVNNSLKISVKNEIHDFFKLADRIDIDSGSSDEELNEFIYAVLDTADEETLMPLFSKGLLHRERTREYMDYLLDSSNNLLVPYLISLSEEEDE